ncbi:hypothetical protein LXL04_021643 [Taraxacum kok-saghyz]
MPTDGDDDAAIESQLGIAKRADRFQRLLLNREQHTSSTRVGSGFIPPSRAAHEQAAGLSLSDLPRISLSESRWKVLKESWSRRRSGIGGRRCEDRERRCEDRDGFFGSFLMNGKEERGISSSFLRENRDGGEGYRQQMIHIRFFECLALYPVNHSNGNKTPPIYGRPFNHTVFF